MNCLSLIEAKRDGQPLSAEQIRSVISAYIEGKVPDYQMAALLMAILFRGMSGDETRALTMALRDSGTCLRFPDDQRPLVDKHSTGGVGDKVSLPLAPLLACLGLRVPMISGRGLGITGGTLDKLESISGFNTALPAKRIVEQVQRIGCVICGQTDEMVPADKALYALRDATGTVPSIPLITASILSKKMAESLDCLLLDVKFGAAAFMRSEGEARELAVTMVRLGNECGIKTRALLSDINTPLGRAAGNWLEVREAVKCLQGKGPPDLEQLVVECAAQLLSQAGPGGCIEELRQQALGVLRSGKALAKWEELLAAQGADLTAYREKLKRDSIAKSVTTVPAPRAGFVQRCDARIVGEVVRDLGGGRLQKDSGIDYAVGVDDIAEPGERVGQGTPLCRIHASNEHQAEDAVALLNGAFVISDVEPKLAARVRAVISEA